MLLTKVRETIRKYHMLDPGDCVVVAVSGGPDSVCLLSVLKELAAEWNLTLHVAHLDHMFRGKESAEEALFVAELAKKLGLPATIEKFDVPAFCAERGLSAQAGAREVRYGFLNRVADSSGASRIALGHTASDQAETVIMRLMRGAGISGLAGIPPKRDKFIRPFIDATREEVLQYLRENQLDFKTDSSNVKPVYTRNRVRMELMPALAKFNPRIVETLANAASLIRDEDEAMTASLASIAPGILLAEEDAVRLKREEFNKLPAALRRRILRAAVETAGADPERMSFIHIDDALAFITGTQTGRAMELPLGLTLTREYDTFVIRAKSRPIEFLARLVVPGATPIPEISLKTEIRVQDVPTEEPLVENYLWQAVFDYDKIALPLYLRSRQLGDRFRPAGLGGGSKKLQDFFVDEKVPRLKRDGVPLLATEEDVLWVVGMRTDGRFLPDAGTKKVLVVAIKRQS